VNRTSHDQLMKQALRERFADFLRLFDPDTAAGLDLDAGVTFRDTETFTDLPQGALLIPDIVAEVRTRDGVPKLVIVHVEVQREREEEDFPRRMWRYFISLTLREDESVIPVALLFYQTAEGVAYEVYEETLFGHTIVTFRYLQISLARLAPQAYDYLHTGNILAIALASIMGRSLRGARRAQLYFDCLRRLLEATRAGEVNQAATRLLGAVIDTYLPVDVEDRVALRVQLEAQGQGDNVMAIAVTELTWRDQVEFQASRKDIRTVIQTRFGQVSPTMQAALQSMQSEEALDAFLRRAAAAPTEDELVEYARRQALEAGDVAATESVALTWRDQIELEAVTRAKREDIRAIIQLRFGQVSPAVEAALESMRQQAALDAFLRRAAVASIEDELLEQPT
jgi:hypothetical protein